jgi:hypothetical protein
VQPVMPHEWKLFWSCRGRAVEQAKQSGTRRYGAA